MKKINKHFITLLFLGIGTAFIFLYVRNQSLTIVDENGSKRPVRIMLFTCQYGSGHKMATQSIVESLPDCDIRVVDIYNEPLASLDPMRAWAPDLSNECIYNKWVKEERNQLLNLSGKIAPNVLALQKKKIQGLLTQYIANDKPDMLISCIPLVNSTLLSVADELKIPLLVITTDIDVSAFCYNLPENLKENTSHFRITVPYEKEKWNELFSRYFSPALQKSFHYKFGYPTRHTFSVKPSRAILDGLRKEYEIQKDENVILIMMGGNAGQASKLYADLLLQMSNEALDTITGQGSSRNKIHLICLCGDTKRPENKQFMESLNALNASNDNGRLRIHGCPATDKIGELASLPELFVVISKPGGSTVNEMIKKKVPMIYHSNEHPLDWERGNFEYGESRGLGKRFLISKHSSLDNEAIFIDLLAEALALRKAMQSGKVPVPEAEINFSSNLRKTIREMISYDGQYSSLKSIRDETVIGCGRLEADH